MDRFKLTAWSKDGSRSQELEPQTLSWGGGWKDCARHLEYSVTPDAISDLGGAVDLSLDGEIIFTGFVVRRSRSALGQIMDIRCMDWGLWLKGSTTCMAVRGQTAEAVAGQICAEFGIPVGSLVATGVAISRNFMNVTLYTIIQTMYTLAAEQTQKKYQLRFRAGKLEVVEKAIGAGSIRLEAGVNILDSQASDSIEQLITSVAVFDKGASCVAEYKDEALQQQYGVFQRSITSSSSEDPAAKARELLEENGVKTTISANCLGCHKLITGTAVAVHEPVTGLDGLFWIQNDQHQVQGGVYTSKVELEFRNLMDKQEAGSLPKG